MTPSPLLPAWLAVAIAAVLAAAVACHLVHMHAQRPPQPASRRRIRTVNGAVMLVFCPLAAYAFGMVSPAEPRAFLLAWLAVMGLLTLVLLLAAIDMSNNARLALAARGRLREEARELARELRRRRDRGE